MSAPPPITRRQSPPSNRAPLYALLVILAMFIAGSVGWIANTWVNGKKDEQRKVASDDQRPKETLKPKENPAQTDDGSESTVAMNFKDRKGVADQESPLVEKKSGREENRATVRPPETGASTGGRGDFDEEDETEKPVEKKTPRLSDLSSFKKNPMPRRIELSDLATKDKTPPKKKITKLEPSSPSVPSKNQYAFPQQSTPIHFYQELIVDRNPAFGIEGFPAVTQKLKYRMISRLSVGPVDPSGFRKVVQKVVSANLVSADESSKKSLTDSLKKQIGKEFRFTLDSRQKLVEFAGEKDKPKAVELKDLSSLKDLKSLEGLAGDGFLLTSVMDLDGWKEIAQLTFLLPHHEKQQWTDQMEHDWGQLGRWVGETQFQKKSNTKGKMRIDYAHWMKYEIPVKGIGGLPFTVDRVQFKSDEAGGRLNFDVEKNRIDSLMERFRVEGELSASLLGSKTKMTLKEVQTFEMYLHDQQPQ